MKFSQLHGWFRKNASIFPSLQPGACTHCAGRFSTCKAGGAYATNVPPAHWLNAAALTSLIGEKSDAHGPGHPLLPFGQFTLCRHFFQITLYSGILPELCETIQHCTASRSATFCRSDATGCSSGSMMVCLTRRKKRVQRVRETTSAMGKDHQTAWRPPTLARI